MSFSYNIRLSLIRSINGGVTVEFYNGGVFEGVRVNWLGDSYSIENIYDWNHIALVKKDSSLYYFFNGNLLGKQEGFTLNDYILNDIGYGQSPYKNRRGSIGSLDEQKEIKTAHLRILNHALWTEDFTPPTKDSYATYII